MPHIAVADATSAVSIQPGAIVSKVIHLYLPFTGIERRAVTPRNACRPGGVRV